MGNEVCTNLCHQKRVIVDLPLPKAEKEKQYYNEIEKVIMIQEFFRIRKYKKKIKRRINEAKLLKKKNVKDGACDFNQSWESYFKHKSDVQFTINGLLAVQKQISDFYSNFFKLRNEKIKDKNNIINTPNIVINEKKLFSIKNSNAFLFEFRIPLIKQMTEWFSMGDLNRDLEKITVEFERVVFFNYKSIEEKNTLENEDNHKTSGDEENKQDAEEDVNTTNNNTIILKNDNWGKKETYKSDKSQVSNNRTNWRTVATNEFMNRTSEIMGVGAVQSSIFRQRRENNIKKLSVDSNNNSKFINKSKQENNSKVTLLISSLEKEENSNNNSINNNLYQSNNKDKCNLKPVNKLELESIIEKIAEEKDQDCKYISYNDKECSVFYQGSWHVKKLCKFGLGFTYMTDNSKGARYKYYGYFKDDVYHGLGLFLTEERYSYFGEFRFGLKCGFGIETTKSDSNAVITYKGFFNHNKYHGYGEYCFKDKFTYFGNFKNGLRDGLGLFISKDGSLYCGNFKFNKMHGLGAFQWPAGHKYYGNWREDKMNGLGRYEWNKGDVYTGYYENDYRHGQGEYKFTNHAVLSGIWRFSKKEGKFELSEGGSKYTIHYRNDVQLD